MSFYSIPRVRHFGNVIIGFNKTWTVCPDYVSLMLQFVISKRKISINDIQRISTLLLLLILSFIQFLIVYQFLLRYCLLLVVSDLSMYLDNLDPLERPFRVEYQNTIKWDCSAKRILLFVYLFDVICVFLIYSRRWSQ
jgi:hypothetical protein